MSRCRSGRPVSPRTLSSSRVGSASACSSLLAPAPGREVAAAACGCSVAPRSGGAGSARADGLSADGLSADGSPADGLSLGAVAGPPPAAPPTAPAASAACASSAVPFPVSGGVALSLSVRARSTRAASSGATFSGTVAGRACAGPAAGVSAAASALGCASGRSSTASRTSTFTASSPSSHQIQAGAPGASRATGTSATPSPRWPWRSFSDFFSASSMKDMASAAASSADREARRLRQAEVGVDQDLGLLAGDAVHLQALAALILAQALLQLPVEVVGIPVAERPPLYLAQAAPQPAHAVAAHAVLIGDDVAEGRPPQQHEITVPVVADLRQRQLVALSSEQDHAGLAVQGSQHHAVIGRTLVGECEDGGAVELAQRVPRAALEQALQPLAPGLVAGRAGLGIVAGRPDAEQGREGPDAVGRVGIVAQDRCQRRGGIVAGSGLRTGVPAGFAARRPVVR